MHQYNVCMFVGKTPQLETLAHLDHGQLWLQTSRHDIRTLPFRPEVQLMSGHLFFGLASPYVVHNRRAKATPYEFNLPTNNVAGVIITKGCFDRCCSCLLQGEFVGDNGSVWKVFRLVFLAVKNGTWEQRIISACNIFILEFTYVKSYCQNCSFGAIFFLWQFNNFTNWVK